jgi:hypothetical protein
VPPEMNSGGFQNLAYLADTLNYESFVCDDPEKPAPEDLLPDFTQITRYETQEWLEAHGVTHTCQGGLWSILMPSKTVKSSASKYIPKAGFVYFISNPETGKIKIGFSDDPERRLADGRTWCPRVVLLKTIPSKDMAADESYYHSKFNQAHFDGEWFLPEKELLEFISLIESATCEPMSEVAALG